MDANMAAAIMGDTKFEVSQASLVSGVRID